MWDAKLEKCLFGRQEVEIPELLMEDVTLYLEVFSLQTWQFVLTETQRQHLMKLLPQFPEDEEVQKQCSLRLLFSGVTFKFGNPLKQFYKKLRNGMFSPEIAKYAVICNKAKEREYRYQQKLYYSSLLRNVLTNRQKIIEVLQYHPPEDFVKRTAGHGVNFTPQQLSLEYRVSQKCHRLVTEVNDECGLTDTASSSDEDDVGVNSSTKSVHKQQAMKRQGMLEISIGPVQDTFAPRLTVPAYIPLSSTVPATVKHKRQWNRTLFLDVSGDHYLFMIHSHKQRKLDHQDHPELDVDDLHLNSIIERVQSTKRACSNGVHKRKFKKFVRKSFCTNKIKVECSPYSGITSWSGQSVYGDKDFVDEVRRAGPKSSSIDSGVTKVYDGCSIMSGSTGGNVHTFSHFFSLIKHFVCDVSEEKISTTKLEELVCEWQESESVFTVNHWRHEISNWINVLPSAIRFLSDGCVDSAVQDFVPLLNYKEKLQQWMWIGHGHDTDEDLTKLYGHWSAHCKDELHNFSSDSSCTVPPPRVWTDYKVKPTTEEQKITFQAQERERFNNPTKAFTYRMHGYEAVVGPVKGVYAKDSSIRPRDHSLLIKDRPPYVTILTLVHDGAARLPNGEGTRSQICELLKDSQFLAPSVTDAQINAVVSGALDRLHYEKDPCVKYDSVRKLWIYRHRYRAEDEFERIHKAQGEVALAKKKTIHKAKVSRVITQKMKDKQSTETGTFTSFIGSDVELSTSQAFNKNDTNLVASVGHKSATKLLSVSSHIFPVSPSSAAAAAAAAASSSNSVVVSSSLIKAQDSVTCSFSTNLALMKNNLSSLSLMKQVNEVSKASNTSASTTYPRNELRSVFMTTNLNKTGPSLSSTEPAIQFVLPTNTSQSVLSCQATASAGRFLHSTSYISQEKLSNVVTLPSTTVFRSIGVKPSLSASPRIITGSTIPRRAPALNTEQMIAIAVPDTSKHNMLIVTRSLSGTSNQSSVTRMAGQLVAGQVIRPVSSSGRPIIVSGQARSVLNAASGRTLQFIGRPVHLIPSNRGSSTHIVQAVRMSVPSDATVTSQLRGISTSIVTSQSLMSHLLQHRPANLSVITHKPISNEGHIRADVHNYVRFSHPQASGRTRLSSTVLPENVTLSPDFSGAFKEMQSSQNVDLKLTCDVPVTQ